MCENSIALAFVLSCCAALLVMLLIVGIVNASLYMDYLRSKDE